MTVRSIALSCLMLLTIAGCATKGPPPPADRESALSGAILVISAWQNSASPGHTKDVSPIYNQLSILKQSLAGGQDDRIGFATHYYIGNLETIIVSQASETGGKPDRSMGQEALTNFDIVLAHGEDIPEWRVSISNTNYLAGGTVFAMDGMNALASRYWDACAKMGHPGCVNNVASMLLRKPSPSDDDIRNAIGLHALVVQTGIQARCAGQYSADTMANLLHFTGVRRPGDDEIAMLDKAQTLNQELKDAIHAKDPCSDGGKIAIDQYMMQFDRGENHEILLDQTIQDGAEPLWQLIAGYLRSKIDDAKMDEVIAASGPQNACLLNFYVAWRATQNGDKPRAQKHYQALTKLPSAVDCAEEPLMMRRYLKLPV
jgi:predicted small lipoprotein YifL